MNTSPRTSSRSGMRLPLESFGNDLHRAQILGDVFTGPAVATRRADGEPAVLVLQRDREAVELRLGDETQGFRHQLLDAYPHAKSSSRENALSSDSMRTRCSTGENVEAGRPPGAASASRA